MHPEDAAGALASGSSPTPLQTVPGMRAGHSLRTPQPTSTPERTPKVSFQTKLKT